MEHDKEDIREGAVFRTGSENLWILTRMDPVHREIDYVMIKADRQCREIHIAVRPVAPDEALATVRYRVTALRPDSEPELDLFMHGFPQRAGAWEKALNAVLQRPR